MTITLVMPATNVFAQRASNQAADTTTAVGSPSVSVGLPNQGHLLESEELGDNEALFVKQGSEDARYGTVELVAMVERAASEVASRHPGSRLTVGDLSRERGGRTRPHRSHRAGRDVDIGFYWLDESGAPTVVDHFVNVGRSGAGRDRRGGRYRFDAARNWALMEAVLTDRRVHVQMVLVAPYIRRLLLDHARSVSADAQLIARFEVVSQARSGSASHRSHFHVRIFCASDDRPRCVDAPPYHDWAFSEAEAEKLLAAYQSADRPAPRRAHRRRARPRQADRIAEASRRELTSTVQ